MLNETQIKEVIISQKEIFLGKRDLFSREILHDFYKKYRKLKEALIITGVRRCGKSSLLRLVWDDFKQKENLSDSQFLYLNFEDERLVGCDKDDFGRLLEIFYELNSPKKNKKIFLFLDEIQNVKYWEKWINRLIEEGKYKIFITGSNATLLSGEMSTTLTGRHITINLFPLSFYEFFVYFKKYVLSDDLVYSTEGRARIKKVLDEYINFGGMPEYIKTKSIELIHEYFKDILLRDIVNRYNVKYKQELKELAHLLLANLGQIYSLQNISKAIEIKNINTIKNYLQYLESSFLFFRVPLFSFSYKRQIYNPDKIYVVDSAFFQTIAFKSSKNIGTLYENLVFLSLAREKFNEIYYYKTKNNFEIDFVVKRNRKIEELIQVSYDIDFPGTLEREERALLEAMKELKVNKGIIINNNVEREKRFEKNKKIKFMPLWRWLLS